MESLNKSEIAHLQHLSDINPMPKKHIEYLHKLKYEGFEPKVIYDIGACVLNWTHEAKKIWPDATYIVFDAFSKVEFIFQQEKLPYHIGVLTDEDEKLVNFYENIDHPGGNSYYREVGTELSAELFSTPILKFGMTLDTIAKRKRFPKPDFVKIDVQGAEVDVMRGGKEYISCAKRLIVELQNKHYNEGAMLSTESLPIIENMGWKCVDPLFSNAGPDGDYGFINSHS